MVPKANSCRLVLPTNTAPASRSRAVTGASAAARCDFRTSEAAVVGTPAWSIRSLSESGMPCSGPVLPAGGGFAIGDTGRGQRLVRGDGDEGVQLGLPLDDPRQAVFDQAFGLQRAARQLRDEVGDAARGRDRLRGGRRARRASRARCRARARGPCAVLRAFSDRLRVVAVQAVGRVPQRPQRSGQAVEQRHHRRQTTLVGVGPRHLQPVAHAHSCSTSSSVFTARRRCGIVIDPPTTSATLNVSKNSSRVTPSSRQRTM